MLTHQNTLGSIALMGAVAVAVLLFAMSGSLARAQSVPIGPQQALADAAANPNPDNVMVLTANGPVRVIDTAGTGAAGNASSVPGIPNTGADDSTSGSASNATLQSQISSLQQLISQLQSQLAALTASSGGVTTPGIPNTGGSGTSATTIFAPTVSFGPSGTFVGRGFGSFEQVRVLDNTGKDLGTYRASWDGVVTVGAFPPGYATPPLTLVGLNGGATANSNSSASAGSNSGTNSGTTQ